MSNKSTPSDPFNKSRRSVPLRSRGLISELANGTTFTVKVWFGG